MCLKSFVFWKKGSGRQAPVMTFEMLPTDKEELLILRADDRSSRVVNLRCCKLQLIRTSSNVVFLVVLDFKLVNILF